MNTTSTARRAIRRAVAGLAGIGIGCAVIAGTSQAVLTPPTTTVAAAAPAVAAAVTNAPDGSNGWQ